MPKMIATAEYSYGGKLVKAGDEFMANDRDAGLLIAVSRAKLVEKADDAPATQPPMTPAEIEARALKAAEAPKPEAKAKPKRQRTYNRRDMKAKA